MSSAGSRREKPSLQRTFSWLRLREEVIRCLLFGCALLSVLTTLAIIFVLVTETLIGIPPHTSFFQEVSLSEFFLGTEWTPNFSAEQAHYGVAPLVCGTLLITGVSGLIGLPTGLMIAVYLSEYASPKARSICKPMLEMLAGVPTVVYGYFGLRFLTPYMIMPMFGGLGAQGYNALCGGIVVGIMIIPMVASLSEDVLRAVPNSLRESGYALGATKFDVSARIVVPSALSGVIASFLLALSRSIGETMAVAICAGNMANLSLNPLEATQTMTAFIVNVMQGEVVAGSTLEKSLYAVALVLFVMTLAMNLISQMILERFREAYQ
ncbi:MAG: phosphate ABC transporter permease subunit PstC [Planctomycetaceae bacterium]